MDKFLHLYRHKDSKDKQYQNLTEAEFQNKLYLVTCKASVLIKLLLKGRTVQMFDHTFLLKLK
jgi:hypothetical protein